MRPQVRQFVKDVAERLPLQGPVYEFGSYQVKGQEELADLRPLFPEMEYVGCDMRIGPGVDRVLNLHAIDLAPAIAGTVLCLDTLEHVEFCHQAAREMRRILRTGGFCVLSSLMSGNIHGYPSDYWRFTPQGFRSLLSCFHSWHVSWLGKKACPHTVFGIGHNGGDEWQDLLK